VLLQHAREAFAERGFAGASLAHIAECAGIRKASLFHHFESKDALYLEAIGTTLAPIGQLVAEAAVSAGDFVARLDSLSVGIARALGGEPVAARLLFRELVDRGRFLHGPGAVVVEQVLGAGQAFLQAGMDEGAIQPGNPAHLMMTLVGVHLAFFAAPDLSESMLGQSPFDEAVVADRAEAVRLQVRRLCGARA